MKCLIVDTYYDQFLSMVPVDPSLDYEANLRRLLDCKFGTFDAWSVNLTKQGWTCQDVIVNAKGLQNLWAKENNGSGNILYAQIQKFQPHVIMFQDLSCAGPGLLQELKKSYLLAAQCSCNFPNQPNILPYDIIFSSIPGHVEHFKSLGVRSVYVPLAFEPSVLNHIKLSERIRDCVFIGGTGSPSHWAYGMKVLNHVAEQVKNFRWYGYGHELLPDGPLRQKYQVPAFGLAMYNVLANSKICINRHGEISGRFANNMKMFEISGMGALLLTDIKDNLSDFFSRDECVAYESPEDAVEKIRYYLNHSDEREKIAAAGQKKTLSQHTYSHRMKTVSDVLLGLL